MFVFQCCMKTHFFNVLLNDCNLNDSAAIPEDREQALLFEKQQQQEETKRVGGCRDFSPTWAGICCAASAG